MAPTLTECSIETMDNRGWNDQNYNFSIWRDEINSISDLVQNPDND